MVIKIKIIIIVVVITRKNDSCDALQLEARPTSSSRPSFWAVFGQICTVHGQKLPFRTYSQNSDI